MSSADTETPTPPEEDAIAVLSQLGGERLDPSAPLTPSRSLRRRHVVSRIMEGGQTASALLALAVLGLVVFSVVEHAASVLSIDFLTKNPPIGAEQAGGGIAPEIVGTAVIVAVATAIAAPVGVLIAIYLTEFAGTSRLARAVGLALDLLNGTPTIIIGLFIFGLLVVGGGQSAIAASIALAIIMLPLIARAVQEVLLLVPRGMREGADALGVARWRSVRGIILPSVLGGIVTATILAVARAAGETAPLVLLSSVFANTVSVKVTTALPNIPMYIFQSSEAASPYGFERAWGAAFVLLAFILLASLGGRALLARSRRKLAA
jgi:phosphate transport system permease protein